MPSDFRWHCLLKILKIFSEYSIFVCTKSFKQQSFNENSDTVLGVSKKTHLLVIEEESIMKD